MEKHENFTQDGVVLLQVRISLPAVSESEEITQFYEELGERAYRFCRDTLLLRAKERYENDPDPRRYLHFLPFRYRLQGDVTYRSDTLLSVRMEASLLRQGEPDKRYFNAHTFALPDGILLSPHDTLSQYTAHPIAKKQVRGVQSVLLTAHSPMCLCGGRWVAFEE
jgi:hypothetical protein